MCAKSTFIAFLSFSFLILDINSKIERIDICEESMNRLFCFSPTTQSIRQHVPKIDKYISYNIEFIENYKLKFVAQITIIDKEDQEIIKYYSFKNDEDIKNLLIQIKRQKIFRINWFFMINENYEDYLRTYEVTPNTISPMPCSSEALLGFLSKEIPDRYSSAFQPSASPEIPDERGFLSE
ncbi:MAG: hypothetical protein P4L22_01400 [Candidatus Babeliales bacterium]|nr:hypothetical protein [Candidatus Babeliales bacterium]